MALTGLQIQKLLPQTNCRECGSNTCLAFAMKLASKKADLSLCPYASDEAKQVLGAASEPPVKSIALGPDKKLVLGEETVLYRHEKTFVKKTAIAININDTDSDEAIDAALKNIKGYVFERVGETHHIDMVSIQQKGTDGKRFVDLAKKAYSATGKPLVLRSQSAGALTQAASEIKGSGSVICASDPDMAMKILPAVKDNGHAIAVTALDIDSLVELTAKIKDTGFNEIILNFSTFTLAERFQTNTIARRSAIKENYKPLGYPFVNFVDDGDILDIAVDSLTDVVKYGGISVLPYYDAAILSSLLTMRLNIFTDPQKPIQVEPKAYPIGEPNEHSPVFLTTNFSLTYFVVSGEIENSGISAWLVVPECEGMSVLTAWAAGKFNANTISKFIKEINFEDQVKTRKIVVPGYVSQISGELEDKLPGWQVLVGPQEASDLESFIKTKIAG